MRQPNILDNLLRFAATLVVCMGFCMGVAYNSSAQGKEDPWEQPPRSLSSSSGIELTPNSSSERPEKSVDRDKRKKATPDSQTAAGQEMPLSSPSSGAEQVSVPSAGRIAPTTGGETTDKSRPTGINIIGGKNITVRENVCNGNMDCINAENVENLDVDKNILITPKDAEKK